MSDWNATIIKEFRANAGEVGGQFDGAPVLLLITTGAKSGKERISPVMYLAEGDAVYVFASKAGAPTHPDWYHNLKKNPRVKVERGGKTYEADAGEITGAERDRLYAEQAQRYPGFAEYEEKTNRLIPVIELREVGWTGK